MSEARLYEWLLGLVLVSGALTFVTLLVLPAPYGRHARPGWGPTLRAPVAWALMEAPSAIAFALFFARGPQLSGPALVLLALWEAHYVPRALLDPWRMRARPSRTPLTIVLTGAAYNVVNAYLNATAIVRFSPPAATLASLARPAALCGLVLFLAGYWTNRKADRKLRALGEHGQGGYGVPRGWLYEHVSCPNYLGEIVEWCGWALLAGTPAGWSFAFFTACNLVPRALAHHRWYRQRFPDYPRRRRALIPRLL